jgi:hypothetical protein
VQVKAAYHELQENRKVLLGTWGGIKRVQEGGIDYLAKGVSVSNIVLGNVVVLCS